MPTLKMNDELGSTIKALRIEYKKKAVEIADSVGKTPVYISKIESAEIKKIEFSFFSKLIKAIVGDDEEGFNNFALKIADKYSIEYTEDEIKSREWLMNIDGIIRQIPLDKDLVEFIKDMMNSNNITIDEMIMEINSNKDLERKNIKDLSKYDYNVWHFHETGSFIKFKVSADTLNKLLDNKIEATSQSLLEVILYSLFKLSGSTDHNARIEANNKMVEYKIYSIMIKQEIMHRKLPENELSELLSAFDINNFKLINEFIGAIKAISELNVAYSNKVLGKIIKNLKSDLTFTFAYFNRDLTQLNKLSRDTKKGFLNELDELIQKYSTIEPSESKKMKLFEE